jgi:hypothetical protein
MPGMAARVSLHDVALRAGVSVSTVSLALSGQGRLSPATRERVTRCATELGYVRDPVVASLAAGRFRHAGKAMIVAALTRTGLSRGNHLEALAPALGMHVVAVDTPDEHLADQLERIGAKGLVVTQHGLSAQALTAMTVATVLWVEEEPILVPADVVENFDWWVATSGAIGRVRAAGSLRPVLVTIPASPRHWQDDVRLGAARHLDVPVHEHDGDLGRLRGFLAEFRPDVVIGNIAAVRRDVERLGFHLPFVCLIVLADGQCDGLTGWRPDEQQQSLVSLELIEQRVRYGPRTPRRITLAPRWRQGPSFP